MAATIREKCWPGVKVLTLPTSASAPLVLQITTFPPAPARVTVLVVGWQQNGTLKLW